MEDFDAAVGATFEIELADRSLPVVLERLVSLPGSPREGGAFRIEWRGPAEPILPQSIYRFRRGVDAWDMFIVPVSGGPEGALYEAIFF
jgi:hypothetical protein